MSRITIRQDEQNATIERDPNAASFGTFHVAASGNLKLYGLAIRNGHFDFEDSREDRNAVPEVGKPRKEQGFSVRV